MAAAEVPGLSDEVDWFVPNDDEDERFLIVLFVSFVLSVKN